MLNSSKLSSRIWFQAHTFIRIWFLGLAYTSKVSLLTEVTELSNLFRLAAIFQDTSREHVLYMYILYNYDVLHISVFVPVPIKVFDYAFLSGGGGGGVLW